MFTIRDFGNNRDAHSVTELRQLLARHYRGRSVSICTRRPSGMDLLLFVDVDDQGGVRLSYGSQGPVDWAGLEQAAA